MSLGWYVRPRMVVLELRSPVLEGARAIENNNIGAVLVHDRGRLVGVVTDRDIAVRVVGRARDPRTTTLSEIMTTNVATLTPADGQSDALRLMLARNVRRIPLVDDGGRAIGIVTLDDLLLDEATPLDQLSEVVRVQLGEGGPAASPRVPSRDRRDARAEATYGRLLNQVRADAGLESAEQAETAVEVVIGALVRRLTPEEARDLIAQLPSLLRSTLESLPSGPDKLITRETIEEELVQRLDVDPARAAQVLAAVAATALRNVSAGQMEDVQRQLPAALRGVFAAPPPPAAP